MFMNDLENDLKDAISKHDSNEIQRILISTGLNEKDWSILGSYKAIQEELPKQYQELISCYLFASFFNFINQSIFIESPSKKISPSQQDSPVTQIESSVIYNNDHYLSAPDIKYNGNIPSHLTLIKGNPLDLNGTPIGYNVHLPNNNEIKGILFYVYGGHSYREPFIMMQSEAESKQEFRDADGHHPGEINSIEKNLLADNFAVVTLNLPDLLELTGPQAYMSEELHNKIHACINKAYEEIRSNPENLNPALSILKDKPMTLSGFSFGGRTAAMHAALYPGTFDSYISSNGSISNEMHIKSDLPHMKGYPVRKYNDFLDPGRAEYIEQIIDPILIIHTRDDTNVNVKVSLDFYNKMKATGKEKLVNSLILDEGNHSLPSDPIMLPHITETISQFIQKGPSDLTTLHDWRAFKQDILANQSYGEASPVEKLMAHIHLTGSDKYVIKNPDIFESTWSNTYEPQFTAFFYADKISKNSNLMATEIERLTHTLTVEDAINALNTHKDIFLKFLEKPAPFRSVSPENAVLFPEKILASLPPDAALTLYRELISSLSVDRPEQSQYFLSHLYFANPSLLQSNQNINPELKKECISSIPNAKKEIYNTLMTEKKMMLNTWKQAIVKAAKKTQHSKEDSRGVSLKKPKK